MGASDLVDEGECSLILSKPEREKAGRYLFLRLENKLVIMKTKIIQFLVCTPKNPSPLLNFTISLEKYCAV